MEYGKPLIPTNITTNIIDDTYPAFDNTSSFAEGTTIIYNDEEIYTARTNIYKLATYSWNQIDEDSSTGVVTKLDDKTAILNTTVPCVQDVTTVYIKDAPEESLVGKYFLYTGNTGDVDFTTIDHSSPANFTEVYNLRNVDAIPSKESLYWDFVNVKNSLRHLDGSLWNQTVAQSGLYTVTNYYTINNLVNKIAFFNMDCSEIKVTVRLESDNSVVMGETSLNMLNLYSINNSYDWHFTEVGGLKKTAILDLPVYTNVIVQIDYIKNTTEPSIGEVIFARTTSMGVTMNNPVGRKKKFDVVTIDDNGNKSISKSNTMKDEITYTVSIATATLDSKITEWSELINEDILIIGDETGTYTNLINYGYISEMPYSVDSSSERNKYQIKVNTLV